MDDREQGQCLLIRHETDILRWSLDSLLLSGGVMLWLVVLGWGGECSELEAGVFFRCIAQGTA